MTRGAVRTVTAACGLVGGVTYSAFLLAPFAGSPLSWRWSFPSELEAAGQPYASEFRLADAVSGLLILLTVTGLHRLGELTGRARAGGLLVALAGVASIADSVTTMSCAPSLSVACRARDESVTGLLGQTLQAHTLSGLAGFLGAAGGMVLIGVVGRDRARGWGTVSISLGLTLATVGLVDIGLLVLHGPFGLAERVRAVLVSLWLIGVAAFAVRAHQSARSERSKASPGDAGPARRHRGSGYVPDDDAAAGSRRGSPAGQADGTEPRARSSRS